MPVFIKKIISPTVLGKMLPLYHWLLALGGAVRYGFPARQIKVVAITGTKGKSTTAEITSALLEAGGWRTALSSTVRFKIDQESRPNQTKMTTPGRFFLQRFLRQAVKAGCAYVVLELSSEGAKQHRHRFIDLDALIFTNLAPEHIESHGSYEKYRAAKLSLAEALAQSPKKNRVLVVNGDDQEAEAFLAYTVPTKISYSLTEAEPYELSPAGTLFTYRGEKISTALPGAFNLSNLLAGIHYAESQGVVLSAIKKGVENFLGVPGRMEYVYWDKTTPDMQPFDIVVDYAHTPDSLKAALGVFAGKRHLTCVLGGTGGGRDAWKRSAMGKVAGEYCDEIIVTTDDPYDDDPLTLAREVAQGIGDNKKYRMVLDRREAIRSALEHAPAGGVVMLSGKGADPCMMGPRGSRLPWSDATVAKEELRRWLEKSSPAPTT